MDSKKNGRIGTDKMSGGPVGDQFSSDNAFSDNGLANREELNKALSKGTKTRER